MWWTPWCWTRSRSICTGDVAIAFSSQQEKSHYQGKDASGQRQFTDVWLKRDGQWRVIASHGTQHAEARSAIAPASHSSEQVAVPKPCDGLQRRDKSS